MSGSVARGLIRGLLDEDNEVGVSLCAPAFVWEDCDTDDAYEAGTSKDGEWMLVTRVSQLRGEVVTFPIPRAALAHVVTQMGGTLGADAPLGADARSPMPPLGEDYK